MSTRIVYGVDYGDGCGVHPAPSRERAEAWVEHARSGGLDDVALVARTVTLSDWRSVAACGGSHAGPCFEDRPDLCVSILGDGEARA